MSTDRWYCKTDRRYAPPSSFLLPAVADAD
jgi:hypothetical protein